MQVVYIFTERTTVSQVPKKKGLNWQRLLRCITFRCVVLNDAQVTAPGAFRWRWQRRLQAIHVVASITIIAEEQLILQKEVVLVNMIKEKQFNSWLTSLSDVPQRPHDLHSIHCQRYFFTERIILAVNWRQVGCAERPQSEQETNSSAVFVFLFSVVSPRQKSQYVCGEAAPLFLGSDLKKRKKKKEK